MSVIDSRFTLETQFDVKRIEEVVRQYWREANIEGKWHEGPENANKWYTFLEGPPTTNGFPHVGHIRGRTYKDVVLRYHRLLGYRVWAQGGWDEQGLPVEIEVEKKLGLRTKKDIEKVGYDKFSLSAIHWLITTLRSGGRLGRGGLVYGWTLIRPMRLESHTT